MFTLLPKIVTMATERILPRCLKVGSFMVFPPPPPPTPPPLAGYVFCATRAFSTQPQYPVVLFPRPGGRNHFTSVPGTHACMQGPVMPTSFIAGRGYDNIIICVPTPEPVLRLCKIDLPGGGNIQLSGFLFLSRVLADERNTRVG
jgi:hypothetical protein